MKHCVLALVFLLAISLMSNGLVAKDKSAVSAVAPVAKIAYKDAAPVAQGKARIEFLTPAPFARPLYGDEKGSKPGIVISGGTASSADIAAAIQDPNKFKKEGDSVTLLAYLLVKKDAELKIVNEKWVFGDSCTLQVQGALLIDRSEITSSNHSAGRRGRIQIPHMHTGWALRITDSRISYMDGVGSIIGSAGAAKEPSVFASNEVVHCADTPKLGGYVIDNWFHDNVQKLSGPGKEAPDSDGNGLLDTGGLFDGNLIENCSVNYLSISWGGGATIANNVYRNLGAIPGGCAFRQKEGEKGSFVRNNLFQYGKGFAGYSGKNATDVANPAVVYSGSTAKEWGEVSGNIIHHWQGVPLSVSGNGYMGMRDVKCRILDNFFFSNSKGIVLSQAKNFQAAGSGPIDVVIRDNSFFDSGSAISGQGEKLVRSGNFVDGKFVDDAPKDTDKSFLRLALAPAAVWHNGRIQTLTLAVAALKPVKDIEATITTPDGKNKALALAAVKETAYPYDYLAEFSTKGFNVGKGTITVSGKDASGKESKATTTFEVRTLKAVSYLRGKAESAQSPPTQPAHGSRQMRIGIYGIEPSKGDGRREIVRVLRRAGNISETSIADLSAKSLRDIDVLILPSPEKPVPKGGGDDWRNAIVKYINDGGRVMLLCGSAASSATFGELFPKVVDVLDSSDLPASGGVGINRIGPVVDYAINEGVSVFNPQSGSVVTLWRGRPDGVVFLRNGDFFPAGVIGLSGKGKVLALGFALGAGPDGKDTPLSKDEQRVLLNSLSWLASEAPCPKVEYYMPTRRLRELSAKPSAVLGPANPQSGLRAGTAKVDITPRREDGSFLPTSMRGFAARKAKSEGVLDKLLARVLVLDDGKQKIAIVSCDLIYPPPESQLNQIRAIVKPKTGIKHVIFAGSHTHSGPNESDIPRIVPLLSEAIIQASKNMQPARVGFGSKMAYGIGNNRRLIRRDENGRLNVHDYFNPSSNIDQPMDHECGVIRIEDYERNVLAVVVNFTCHPSMLPVANLRLSGDFTAMAMNEVEKALGGKTVALFLQGAAGNIGGSLEKTLENAATLSSRLSRAVLETLRHVDVTGKVRLGFAESDVALPTKDPLKPASMKVRSLSLNDDALVFLTGEVFAEIGLKIKFASPFEHTYVVGYTGAHPRKYFPARRAFALGEYEVSLTPYAAEAEDVLLKRVSKVLGELSSQ